MHFSEYGHHDGGISFVVSAGELAGFFKLSQEEEDWFLLALAEGDKEEGVLLLGEAGGGGEDFGEEIEVGFEEGLLGLVEGVGG